MRHKDTWRVQNLASPVHWTSCIAPSLSKWYTSPSKVNIRQGEPQYWGFLVLRQRHYFLAPSKPTAGNYTSGGGVPQCKFDTHPFQICLLPLLFYQQFSPQNLIYLCVYHIMFLNLPAGLDEHHTLCIPQSQTFRIYYYIYLSTW